MNNPNTIKTINNVRSYLSAHKFLYKVAFLVLIFLLEPASVAEQVNSVTSDFAKVYTGKIDGKYSFNMVLRKHEGQLTGTYRYAGKIMSLSLEGSIDSSNSFTIDEYVYAPPKNPRKSSEKLVTGVFVGKVDGTMISGAWHTPDKSKTMFFEAKELSKQDAMQNAIGTYEPDSIESGPWLNVYKKGGRWIVSSLGISDGMRQGQEDPLTPADIALLDSMYVSVDDDLSVNVYARGKLLLHEAFRTNGIDYRIEKSIANEMNRSSPITDFSNGVVYLAAIEIDQALYADILKAVDFKLDGDVALLNYSAFDDVFILRIFNASSCCETNTIEFKRKKTNH